MTEPSEGLWLSIDDLAKARGVDKSTISRRVAKLEADGLLQTKKTGKCKMVNAAAFDRASGETSDAIRSLAISGDAKPRPVGKILAHEQARKIAYQADLAQLDLDERLGKLLPIDHVIDAVSICAESVLLTVEQLPARAEEIAAAVGRDGPQGARAALKAFTYDIRKAIERAMAELDAKGLAAPTAESAA